VEEDNNVIKVVDAEGKEQETPAKRPDILGSGFPRLPFSVDVKGNLYLKKLCVGTKEDDCTCQGKTSGSTGVFDLYGDPVQEEDIPFSAQETPLFKSEGLYISEALDSKLAQCQWHRVILRGTVPTNTRIVVATYTAETIIPIEQLRALPDESWDTRQTVLSMDGNNWDCLIRSGQGRFLWLKLALRGNGSGTPVVESIKIEFPRISLRRYLPAVFGEDPAATDFTDRFLAIFDTTLRSIEKSIDEEARFFDPMSAPADSDPKNSTDFLSWLASWIGLTFDRQWSVEKRRIFLKQAGRLNQIRGTREGLWRQLVLLLGMDPAKQCCAGDQPATRCGPEPVTCEPMKERPWAWQPPRLILEHYQLRRWLFVGAGRLGDQAVLWGKRIVNRSQLGENARVGGTQVKTAQDPYRDPFHVYAHRFSVFVPASYGRNEGARRSLENLVNSEKPAHTICQVEYVEPRFRIGFQSMIGFDSVVGRYPEGVTLDQATLGRATVLGEPPHKRGGPSLEIGKDSRVGFTTALK
jgi:phage tail-like protein